MEQRINNKWCSEQKQQLCTDQVRDVKEPGCDATPPTSSWFTGFGVQCEPSEYPVLELGKNSAREDTERESRVQRGSWLDTLTSFLLVLLSLCKVVPELLSDFHVADITFQLFRVR